MQSSCRAASVKSVLLPFCDSQCCSGPSSREGEREGLAGLGEPQEKRASSYALPLALASADFSQLRQGSICLGFCLGVPQPHCHRVTFNFATSLRHWAASS